MRSSTAAAFDIRFVDTKSGPDDHPWRMSYTIDQNNFNFDNDWHQLFIPLTDFKETGSWDNGNWFNPEGKFDWTVVDNFQLVAEQQSLEGIKIWFDNLVISDSLETPSESSGLTTDDSRFSIFPNPASQTITIRYHLAGKDFIKIEIWSLTGEKISVIENGYKHQGSYTYQWNVSTMGENKILPGLYICRFQSSKTIQNRYLSIIY
jgi:hypothetical protein